MKVLHICSYFNTSSLYKNLFESLDKNIDQQIVYIPMYRKQSLIKEYGTVRRFEKDTKYIKFIYDRILPKYAKRLLFRRVHMAYSRLIQSIHIYDIDIMHAHSLLFNGGVAYMINKKLNIPYIVAVRNTDLKVLSKIPLYRPLAKRIITNSQTVVFISNTLRKKFIKLNILDESIFNGKTVVIPNGIRDDWYDNSFPHKKFDSNMVTFLYQGTFHRRKNIDYSIKLIESLNQNGYSCQLKIIGSGPDEKRIRKIISKSPCRGRFELLEWSNNRDDIMLNYKNADIFIMISRDETFGISYIESLACQTPILYSKDDGIDGMLTKWQGVALSGDDFDNDLRKTIYMIEQYKKFRVHSEEKTFKWSNIGAAYLKLYEKE